MPKLKKKAPKKPAKKPAAKKEIKIPRLKTRFKINPKKRVGRLPKLKES